MNASKILRSSAPIIATAAVAGAAAYTIQRRTNAFAVQQCEPENKPIPKTFTSGLSFQNLKLRSSEDVNHNTKRLRFDLPSPDAISGLSPVSAVLIKATVNGTWLPTLRPYTPISDPNERGHIDLLVKRYPDGKMSKHLHALQPGQTLSFKTGPLEGYPWTPNQHAHVALVAGGAGITPIYQLTQAILGNPQDRTKITLVFGVNTDADLLFQEEFAALERKFGDRFRCVYTVSSPVKDSGYPKGYVTRELLEKVIPSAKEDGVKVLFCGPPAMEKAIAGPRGMLPGSQGAVGGVLKELGYSQDQVFKL